MIFKSSKMSGASAVTPTAATVVVPNYATKWGRSGVKLTPGCLRARPSRRVQSVFCLVWASEVIWGSGFSLNGDRKEGHCQVTLRQPGCGSAERAAY